MGQRFHKAFFCFERIKQGGIISSVSFSISTDYILHGLKSNGMGCHVGAVFAGALAYGDDIVLLSRSRSALHEMLDNVATLRYQAD